MKFVAYNDKSSAKRGLNRKTVDLLDPELYLAQEEGKWGFYMADGAPVLLPGEYKGTIDDMKVDDEGKITDVKLGNLSKVRDEHVPAEAAADDQGNADPQPDHIEDDGEDHSHPVFGGFAFGQLANNGTPQEPAARTQTLTKIERNRPESNGVKRPSAGTLCDQVWQTATELSNGDEMPRTKIATLSEVVKACEAKGINKYTARTQYARWRVFHGITGRLSN
jgi:hypothetical protein